MRLNSKTTVQWNCKYNEKKEDDFPCCLTAGRMYEKTVG